MENDALKNEFLVESFENLSSINEDLTHLEKDPNNTELLNKIYRTVHTMKGSASFLGYKILQDLTHAAENLLDELREGNIAVSPSIIDTLLETFDLSQSILKSIEQNDDEGNTDISKTKTNLEKLLAGEEAEIAAPPSAEPVEEGNDSLDSLVDEHKQSTSSAADAISSAAMESLQELVAEGKIDESSIEELNQGTTNTSDSSVVEADSGISAAALASLEELVADGKVDANALAELSEGETTEVSAVEPMPDVEPDPEPETLNALSKPEESMPEEIKPEEKKSIVDSFVRVNVNVLDKIMNVVGELVLNRNQILQFAGQNDNSEFNRLSQQLNVITSELQSEVMSTRMQPIGNTLNKFERLVRDIARSNDKKIDLKLIGQETELDKSLIETIKDPLVHIIRNSCDHGIEGTQDRKLAGKSESGLVMIKAYNEGGQVTIEISDDGRGLDSEKIGRKALEKGLLSPEKLEAMTENQILNMIFKPGFSTAEKVTNISGRGVGMDVVKTNIEKIGGTVNVSSQKGEGTTFKLKIPLTLAIVPALMIKSKHESFAIPQLNLVELVRLETEEDFKNIENISGSEFLRLRGNLTPIFRLDKELSLEEVHEKSRQLQKAFDPDTVEDRAETSTFKSDEAANIVILNAEDNIFGIVVDEILDTEEIVVKPLNNTLKEINIFGGATIMGDGKVALILDTLGFLTAVSRADIEKSNKDNMAEEESMGAFNTTEMQENLLFTLFDGRTYAVPLGIVSRLEEINVEHIERTGHQKIVRYLDAPMPLLNVEKILGLDGESSLESYQEQGVDSLSCIVTTIAGKNFGIIVKEVLDISIDQVTIDNTAVDREGILGTVFIDDHTISLLDLYTIVGSQKLGASKIFAKNDKIKGKKILLVDDSPMYRKMEADALREIGYDVTTANHGGEGFDLLASNDYDLLITDIEMPHLDGFNFAHKVRTELTSKTLPIMALSTRVSDKDKEKGKQCGFDYHLEKFRKDEVITLVNNILEDK